MDGIEAMYALAEAGARASKAMELMTAAFFRHSAIPGRSRRQIIEDDLGYKVPDWVWQVWETQRETFGSGNGRR